LGNHRWQSAQSRLALRHGSRRPTILVAAAKREDAERFIVHADKKLTAFLEVEAELNSVEHIASTHEVEQDGLSTRARV